MFDILYTIRYFQYDSEGTLRLVDGPVLVNNDRVLLESKSFRLNYTAKSAEAHKFLVVVEDNFGSTPWVGAVNKSSVYRKLKNGNRDIYQEYIAHCHYKGKKHSGLLKRRMTEFAVLFVR